MPNLKTDRVIEVPRPIAVEGPVFPNGEKPEPKVMDFAEFLDTVLLNQPMWGKSVKNVRTSQEVADAAAKPGVWVVELSDATWKLLCECVNDADGFGIQPWALRQLLPFFDAILSAKTRSEWESENAPVPVKDA